MNTFYDKIAASTVLEGRIRESPRNAGERDVMPLWDVEAPAFELFAVGEPPSYRLKDIAFENAEEVTFRVRGILCYKRLPPIHQVKNANTIAFLRQTVQLTSFSPGSRFEEYMNKIDEITALFESSVPGKVNRVGSQIYEGQRALVISNPYFTSRHLTPSLDSLPLGSNVDPTGYLTRSQPQNFHHTMDNQVVYLKEHVGNTDVKFRITSPANFENGDIVEAQFAFVAFPLAKKKDEYQICMCLRALILLDDSFRRASLSSDTCYDERRIPVFSLKRKVIYSIADGDAMESDEMGGPGGKRFCIDG